MDNKDRALGAASVGMGGASSAAGYYSYRQFDKAKESDAWIKDYKIQQKSAKKEIKRVTKRPTTDPSRYKDLAFQQDKLKQTLKGQRRETKLANAARIKGKRGLMVAGATGLTGAGLGAAALVNKGLKLRFRRKALKPVPNPMRNTGTRTWSSADDVFLAANKQRQAVKASFAKSLVGGKWVKATKLTSTQRAMAPGSHVRAAGVQNLGRPIEQRSNVSGADQKVADRVNSVWRDARAGVDEWRKDGVKNSTRAMRGGAALHTFKTDSLAGPSGATVLMPPKPGQGQRKADRVVILNRSVFAPKKINQKVADHEIKGHATRRKATSAWVRMHRDPKKLYGDEGRSDAQMGGIERKTSVYNMAAYGKGQPRKEAKKVLRAQPNPIYHEGLEAGGLKSYRKAYDKARKK
jgi:hypothetical protein